MWCDNVEVGAFMPSSDHFGISFDMAVICQWAWNEDVYSSLQGMVVARLCGHTWRNVIGSHFLPISLPRVMWSLRKNNLWHCINDFVHMKRNWFTNLRLSPRLLRRQLTGNIMYKSWKKNSKSWSYSDYLLYKRNVIIATREIRKAKEKLQD